MCIRDRVWPARRAGTATSQGGFGGNVSNLIRGSGDLEGVPFYDRSHSAFATSAHEGHVLKQLLAAPTRAQGVGGRAG
eukprot:8845807-Alexandrium_andersonii.AAC.1